MKVRSAAVAVGSKREAVEWAFIFYSRSEKYGHMVDGSKTTYSEGAWSGEGERDARYESKMRTWGLRESNNREAWLRYGRPFCNNVDQGSEDSELLTQHERQNYRRIRSLTSISKQRTQWHQVDRIWIAPFSVGRGGNNGRRGQLLSCTSGWTPATPLGRLLWPSPSSSSIL